MTRGMTLAILTAFMLGLAAGCSPWPRPAADGSGGADPAAKPDYLPKPITKEELPANKAKLADLEKLITAKDEELAALRGEVDVLRKQIAAAEGPKENVYGTPEELFADMPMQAYPRFGPDAGIERAAARKWCEANLIGRTVEWTTTVQKVIVSGDGLFTVELRLEGALDASAAFPDDPFHIQGVPFGDSFLFGNQQCHVILVLQRYVGLA